MTASCFDPVGYTELEARARSQVILYCIGHAECLASEITRVMAVSYEQCPSNYHKVEVALPVMGRWGLYMGPYECLLSLAWKNPLHFGKDPSHGKVPQM